MRPREREEEAPSLPESSPPRAPPARTGLSSMVVLPSESDSDGSGDEAGEPRAATDVGRRLGTDSPPPRRRELPPGGRRRGSPPGPRRRELTSPFRRHRSPMPIHRQGTPPDLRRRGSPPRFQPRFHRFHENEGYDMHVGSISPSLQRKADEAHYGPEFDTLVGPRYGNAFQGGRGGGRFRDISPRHGFGRGGRSGGRGYSASGRELSSADREYVHRNDPNLSPREGDWICRNPTCGNLNFARRTHCNNCNKYRYAPDIPESGRSSRRGYFSSPPPRCSPARMLGPPVDNYRSPCGWGMTDPRGFVDRSPPGHVGRFADHVRRGGLDCHEEFRYRDGGKYDWLVPEGCNHRDRPRDGFFPDRAVRRSPSPRGHWVRDLRERSRSPIGDRPYKSSFPGRGRDDRDYVDPYAGRGRARDLDMGQGRGRDLDVVPRGRGYRHGNDALPGRGRGDQRIDAHGRNNGRNNGNIY